MFMELHSSRRSRSILSFLEYAIYGIYSYTENIFNFNALTECNVGAARFKCFRLCRHFQVNHNKIR